MTGQEQAAPMGAPLGDWRALAEGGALPRLLLICFGVWLHASDGLIVATMMPGIVADIGGARLISWTIALYELGSIVAGASSAWLAVRFGLRRAMAVAALVYMVGCVASAIAPAMEVMLAGRLIQGLGGGGLMAMSFVAVSRLFSTALMPRVMAAVSALWGVSAFVGPLAGGIFAGLGVWRGGFWFLAVQAAFLSIWIGFGSTLSVGDRGAATTPPLGRLAALSLGVLAICSAGIDVSLTRTPPLIVAGLALLGLFLRLDARHESGRLTPRGFLDPRHALGAGFVMVLCFTAASIPPFIYGPLLMTRLDGAAPLTAGYILGVSSIGWSATAVLVAGGAEKNDGVLILAGMGLEFLSLVGFAILIPFGPLWSIAPVMILQGSSLGMAWTFILRRLSRLAPADEQTRVASALPTLQRLGYALGAAFAGIVANAAGISDMASNGRLRTVGLAIFASCLPLALFGLAAAWRFARPVAAPR
jgi:MFS family permease